eukprot:ctg_1159.g408
MRCRRCRPAARPAPTRLPPMSLAAARPPLGWTARYSPPRCWRHPATPPSRPASSTATRSARRSAAGPKP